jgi:hypothetical protein
VTMRSPILNRVTAEPTLTTTPEKDTNGSRFKHQARLGIRSIRGGNGTHAQ